MSKYHIVGNHMSRLICPLLLNQHLVGPAFGLTNSHPFDCSRLKIYFEISCQFTLFVLSRNQVLRLPSKFMPSPCFEV